MPSWKCEGIRLELLCPFSGIFLSVGEFFIRMGLFFSAPFRSVLKASLLRIRWLRYITKGLEFCKTACCLCAGISSVLLSKLPNIGWWQSYTRFFLLRHHSFPL